jgi:hypothetical protein
VANPATTATVVTTPTLEGWSLVAPAAGKTAAFQVWATADRMREVGANTVAVGAADGNGSRWLGLSNGGGGGVTYQTLGIQRDLATLAGARYTLSLDYAGALGFSQASNEIGIYLDGQRIASYANTSSRTALNWQALSFQFDGNGQTRRLTIRLEGGDAMATSTATMRGALIDDLRVIETLPVGVDRVYGLAGTAVNLPQVTAALTDTRGTETLTVELLGLVAGMALGDGVHSAVVTTAGQALRLTGWDLSRLDLQVPAGFTGELALQLRATSTEASNGASASVTQTVTVQVLAGARVATPAGVNPYVRLTAGTTGSERGAGNASVLAAAPGTVLPRAWLTERGTVQFQAAATPPGVRTPEEEAEAERLRQLGQGDAWLVALEQAARAQWQALAG